MIVDIAELISDACIVYFVYHIGADCIHLFAMDDIPFWDSLRMECSYNQYNYVENTCIYLLASIIKIINFLHSALLLDMYYLDIDFFVKDVEENPVKEKTQSKSKSTAAASLSYVEMDEEGYVTIRLDISIFLRHLQSKFIYF